MHIEGDSMMSTTHLDDKWYGVRNGARLAWSSHKLGKDHVRMPLMTTCAPVIGGDGRAIGEPMATARTTVLDAGTGATPLASSSSRIWRRSHVLPRSRQRCPNATWACIATDPGSRAANHVSTGMALGWLGGIPRAKFAEYGSRDGAREPNDHNCPS